MMNGKKICIVGASGKLGQYMVRHALERGYAVVGVCRELSVGRPLLHSICRSIGIFFYVNSEKAY
jgi:nucleoside-diphosphate-sugar epimerase